MVATGDSKSPAQKRVGSSPTPGTNFLESAYEEN